MVKSKSEQDVSSQPPDRSVAHSTAHSTANSTLNSTPSSTPDQKAANARPPSTATAVFELSLAGVVWGFGFIAAKWALVDLGPVYLTVLRFLIAAAVGILIIFCTKTGQEALKKMNWGLAFVAGLLLAATLGFQTWGLCYTTATKSGFITTLYVLLVPILERGLLHRPLHRLHWLFATLALIGTAFICDFQAGDWNIGDFLTLLCAVAASFHILLVGVYSDRIGSPFPFNVMQLLFAGLLVVPFLALQPPQVLLPKSPEAWAGLISLTFGSTLIGFMLQVKAQKILSPSIASLLYLLESPFATLFAITLLGETLNLLQWSGAALILVAAAAASWLATSGPNTRSVNSPP